MTRSPSSSRSTLVVVPVHDERVIVGKREAKRERVRFVKRIETHDEAIDASSTREDIHVERVAINRVVDEPPKTRQEGATTIVPVLEETIVLTKKLLLREEIRITKTATVQPQTVNVTLRREVPEISREIIDVSETPNTDAHANIKTDEDEDEDEDDDEEKREK